MIAIPGYRLEGRLRQTSSGQVYAGTRTDDGQSVVIKIVTHSDAIGPECQVRRERELLAMLPSHGFCRPLEVRPCTSGWALVMARVPGESLAELMAREPVGLGLFFDLAVEITQHIAAMHARNLVHRDLKPSNIMWEPASGVVTIIDVGIAAALTDLQEVDPDRLEGSLPFMAPEQTGRLGIIVDERADLYSLGVTFYALLSGGRLPLQASTPTEWVHVHVASDPQPLEAVREAVPTIVVDLVSRLLAKAPSDRYQTAAGLLADLKRLRRALQDQGELPKIQLGSADVATRLELAECFHGRTAALERIEPTLTRQARGYTQFLSVAAPWGGGKTALLRRYYTVLARGRQRVAFALLDQLESQMPLAALNAWLATLTRLLLGEADIKKVRSRLQRRLGMLCQSLIEATPSLAPLLIAAECEHDLNRLDSLTAPEAITQLRQAYCALFEIVADPQRPLILLLDDLHTADEASLEVLQDVLLALDRRSGPKALMCIASYPPDDIQLRAWLQRLGARGVDLSVIELPDLVEDEVVAMVAHSFRVPPDTVIELAAFLEQRTGGRPGLIRAYLEYLIQHRVLRRHRNGTLDYDLSEIREAGLPDKTLAMVARRMAELRPATRTLLAHAAHLGPAFALVDLLTICPSDRDALVDGLDEALYHGIVIRRPGGFAFGHARLRELAGGRLDRDTQGRIRVQHVRQRLARGPAGVSALFELASDLNEGPLDLTPLERIRAAELNLRAGRHALSTAAPGTASKHFEAGLDWLAEAKGDMSEELRFLLRLGRANAKALSASAEEVDVLYRDLQQDDLDHTSHARLFRAWIGMHARVADHERALAVGLEGLQRYHATTPGTVRAEFNELVPALAARLAALDPEAFGKLKPARDQRFLAECAIATEMSVSAFLCARELGVSNVLRLALAMLEHGMTSNGPLRLMGVAVLFATKLGDHEVARKYGDVAIQLAETLGDRRFLGRTKYLHAWLVRPYRDTLDECLTELRTATRRALEVGDLDTYLLASQGDSTVRFMLGEHLDVMRLDLERVSEVSLCFGDSPRRILLEARQRVIALLQGSAPEEALDSDQALLAFLNLGPLMQGPHHHFQGVASFASFALLLLGRYQIAFEISRSAYAASKEMGSVPRVLKGALTYGLSAARLIPDSTTDEARPLHAVVDRALSDIEALLPYEPGQAAYLLALLRAERARACGHTRESLAGYRRALEGARSLGHPHVAALVHEALGSLSIREGMPLEAGDHMEAARAGYETWGAHMLAQRVERCWSDELEISRAAQQPANQGAPVAPWTTSGSLDEFDTETLLRISQTIIQQTDLNAVLEHFLAACIQTAGARSGTLILDRDGKLVVEAVGRAGGEFERVAILLQDYQDVPHSILVTVHETLRPVYVDDALASVDFGSDPWVVRTKARSVLCLPILRQSRLVGLAFLENNLLPGVFAPERCQLIQHVSVQAAVSLDNARLYAELSRSNAELEQRVNDRTKELQLAKDQAEQARRAAVLATRAKSEFLASMSHEIRTPMNGVLGMAQLLAKTELTAEQREYLQTIEDSGQALLTIINDILDLSKIEAGKMELESVRFNLRDCIEGVGDMLAPKAQEKGLEMSILIDQNLPSEVRGDSGRLRQLVINLVNNAIKFTQRGRVTVRVRMENSPSDQVCLYLKVIDTGIGIDSTRIEQLFVAFTQADASTTRRFGGTGLGLAISKRLAEAMGGEIGADSQPGQGSTFWFRARLGSCDQQTTDRVPDAESVTCFVLAPKDPGWEGLAEQLRSLGADPARVVSLEPVAQRLAVEPEHPTLLFVRAPLPVPEEATLVALQGKEGLTTVVMPTIPDKAEAEARVSGARTVVIGRPARLAALRRCLLLSLGRADRRGPQREQEAPASILEEDRTQFRILVVEDNRGNQMLAVRMLKKLGYEATVVENGRQAVDEITSDDSWDLVLMDCQMPEMDGFEATRRIRDHELLHGGKVPIIALTANAMKGDKEACLAAGMTGYLSKPINVDQLAAMLSRYLGGGAGAASSP